MGSIYVAGAEGFLGRNTVLHFLKRGERVFGSCLGTEQVSELTAWLTEQLGRKPAIDLYPVSLSDSGAVESLVRKVLSGDGALSRVVNCAGGFAWVKIADSTQKQAQGLMDSNYFGNWSLLKHWLPALAKQKQGRLVVISAAASTQPAGAGMGLYCASKAALNCLVDAANEEFKDTSVRVRALYPTIIDTPRNRADMPSADFSKWMTVAQVVEKIEQAFA